MPELNYLYIFKIIVFTLLSFIYSVFFYLSSEYAEVALYVTTLIYISSVTISYELYSEEKYIFTYNFIIFIFITLFSHYFVFVCVCFSIPTDYIIFISKFMMIYFISSSVYQFIVQTDKAEWYEFFIFLPFYLLFLFYTFYIYFYNYNFNWTVLFFMVVILLIDVLVTGIIEKKYLYFLKNNHNMVIHTLWSSLAFILYFYICYDFALTYDKDINTIAIFAVVLLLTIVVHFSIWFFFDAIVQGKLLSQVLILFVLIYSFLWLVLICISNPVITIIMIFLVIFLYNYYVWRGK